MYSTILTFLIAVTINSLAPVDPSATWSPDGLLTMAAILGLTWFSLRRRLRQFARAAFAARQQSSRLKASFTRIVQSHQLLALVPYALFTYMSPYHSLISAPLADKSELLSSVLGLLPFLLMWLMVWWEAYPLKTVLFGTGESRLEFIKSHSRMELAVVAPWLLILLLGDVLSYLWPSLDTYLAEHPLAQLMYAPAFLTVAAVLMPVLVKKIWGCTPIPPGPLRDRLEERLRELDLKVGEILFWPLLGGRMITAGIVGPVGRFRYLLLTPALVAVLDADELDGVVSHETGHVRYHHLWYYLFFFMGVLVGGLAILFQLMGLVTIWWASAFPGAAEAAWANTAVSIGYTLGMGAVLIFSFRYLFGKLSRAFERQADLFALESMGRARPVASALETISMHSGDIRDLPSWHHGSVGERVDWIMRAGQDPSLAKRHHAYVRRLKTAVTAVVVTLFVVAGALYATDEATNLKYMAALKGYEYRLERSPEDAMGWMSVGALNFELGHDGEAVDAYLTAASIAPGLGEAYNASAWVLATSDDAAVRDPDRAVELAKKALTLIPSPHVLDTLAEALYARGDVADALTVLDEAIRASGEDDPNRAYYMEKRRRFAIGAGGTEAPAGE